MQGYAILAESLAKQKVQHCYGIVGMQLTIQVFQSLSSALPFRATASITMAVGISSRLATVQAILATSLEFPAFASASQGQDTPTLSVELPMPGLIAGR
jgi:hypothetical protein